jgi:pimeloyl-ACP methyl ester carboxylesterase
MKSAWGNASPLTADVHRAYLERFPDADSRSLVLWPLACALTDSDAFYRSQWDRREALERIPALLVWGMRDSAFGPDYLARWRRALPRAETVELSESGHWPHEEEPARVASAIEAFLDLAS